MTDFWSGFAVCYGVSGAFLMLLLLREQIRSGAKLDALDVILAIILIVSWPVAITLLVRHFHKRLEP